MLGTGPSMTEERFPTLPCPSGQAVEPARYIIKTPPALLSRFARQLVGNHGVEVEEADHGLLQSDDAAADEARRAAVEAARAESVGAAIDAMAAARQRAEGRMPRLPLIAEPVDAV